MGSLRLTNWDGAEVDEVRAVKEFQEKEVSAFTRWCRRADFSLSLSAVCLLSVCWPSSKVTRAIRFVKAKECHYVIKKLPLKPCSRWAVWICKFSARPGSRNMSSKVIEKRVFDGAWIKTSFSTSSEPVKIHLPSRSWLRQMPIWCRWES